MRESASAGVVWAELIGRCEGAASVLDEMADDSFGEAEQARLRGKAQGVRFALSYIREAVPK